MNEMRKASYVVDLDADFGRDVVLTEYLMKIYYRLADKRAFEEIEDELWDILAEAKHVRITIEEYSEPPG